MEREDRNLYREGREETEEQPELLGFGQCYAAGRERVEDVEVIERTGPAMQVEDGREHQHGAEHRVHEEFDGHRSTARAAPRPDQEVHGHKSHFPEDVEDEQV